jgi:glycosyltransferase involved in cell wall biosynthesis
LQDVVEMPGSRPGEQVRSLLASAGLFVLPSRVTEAGDRDGIPVALMEAMASGVPSVSTQVSGIPELIRHGKNGLLVPADDPGALSRAIERVMADPAKASEMAVQARATVESDFDVSREAAKLLDLFETRSAHAVMTSGEQVA